MFKIIRNSNKKSLIELNISIAKMLPHFMFGLAHIVFFKLLGHSSILNSENKIILSYLDEFTVSAMRFDPNIEEQWSFCEKVTNQNLKVYSNERTYNKVYVIFI